ncbi:MAG: Uma2 family endonuclease [Gemmatimonadetes bacterium]|nr:Uma2 family endonuclease [Gemmatimonadota bacterium]
MSTPLRTHNFTVDEYHRMGEAGVFHEDDRVELLDGQIVEMTPIGGLHVACVIRLTDLLSPVMGSGAVVSVQNPLVLADRSVPQSDIALLRRRADPSGAWLPSHADCLLVIEVADTSVEHDRDVKIPLYARAGIPEVWLVDLSASRIEVYRNPAGGSYAEVTSVSGGETLTPLLLPDARLSVADVLG